MINNTFESRLSNSIQGGVKSSFEIEGMVITCRSRDGYVNATQLCKAANDPSKKFGKWNENQNSQEFLRELSSVIRIRITELIDTIQGGTPQYQGTWVHPRVAIHIAQWVSPKFAARVTGWIHELLVCGSVSYGYERSSNVVMQEQLQQLQNTIHMKDAEINSLQSKLDHLIRQNDELRRESKLVLEATQNTSNELKGTRQELIQTHQLLETTSKELTHTRYIVEDLAERAVPIVHNEGIREVLLIYHVRNSSSDKFGIYLNMKGVQQRGIDKANNEIKRKYGKDNYKLLKSYECSPNSIMLKAAIRELTNIVCVRYNDITLLKDYNADHLISIIDTLHSERY